MARSLRGLSTAPPMPADRWIQHALEAGVNIGVKNVVRADQLPPRSPPGQSDLRRTIARRVRKLVDVGRSSQPRLHGVTDEGEADLRLVQEWIASRP